MKRLLVGICIASFAILNWQCSKAKDTIKQMEAALASANQTNTATSSDTLYVSQTVDSIDPPTTSTTSASTSVTTTVSTTVSTTGSTIATLATTSVDSAGNTSVQVSSSTSSSSSSSSGSSSGALVGPTVTDVVTVTILSTDIQTETAPTRLAKIAQLIYNQVPKKYTQMLTKLEFIGAMLKIRDMHRKHDHDDDDAKTLSGKRLVKIVGCLSDQFTQFQNSNQMLTFTALEALLLANAPNIMEYRKYYYYHYGRRYEHNCGNLYSVFRELVDRESHYFAIPGLRNFSDSHQDDEWQPGYMGPGGWLPGRWNNPFNTDATTETEVNTCQPNIGASCKADTDCSACVSMSGRDSLTMMTTVQCVNSKCQRTGCPILPPGPGMTCTGCTGNQPCVPIPTPIFGSSSGTGTPVTATSTNTNTNTNTNTATHIPIDGPHTLPIINTKTSTFTSTATATSTATCTPNVNKSCTTSSQCNQCIPGYTPGSNSNSIPAAVDCINRKCTQMLSNGCPINFSCSSNKQCVCTATAPCRCQ